MRCLGIDFGSSRIGIAISDDLGMLAHPLETISNDSEFLSRLQQIVLKKGVSRIVVGIPRNMDGSYGPAAEKAKLFLSQLKSQCAGVQLIGWDERLTTVEAQRLLHAAGRDIKKSRPVIDQVAAQVLLQSYLDSVAGAGQ
ncbi:MAG TPA: Holliday junction resolvase RuvX [Chthoniobacterales bacterium]|nr:Holliday junction resolvase RuvX [Chthoniobacterales bacterium]